MKDPTPININGVMCYHVKQFAALTNRTTQSVYGLIRKGNSIRKLRVIYIERKPYVEAKELVEFPFTPSGPLSEKNIYHYNNQGDII